MIELPAPGFGTSRRLQPERFGDAQSGAVEQREHRGVSCEHPGLAILARAQLGVGEPARRRHGERLRQRLLDLRRTDRGERRDAPLALAFEKAGERARAGERPHQRAAADAIIAPMRHEGAHVPRRQLAQHGEADAAAEMIVEEGEKLAHVAAIGLDGFRRHPPLGAEIGEPLPDFAGGIRGGIEVLGSLRFARCRCGLPHRVACRSFAATPYWFISPGGVSFLKHGISAGPMAKRIVDVLVPVALDHAYSYRVPEDLDLAPGDLVRVALGVRECTAVVWAENENPNPRLDNRLKDIEAKLDIPPLKPELRKFVEWVSGYTLSPRGMVLRMALRMGEQLGPERDPHRRADGRRRRRRA